VRTRNGRRDTVTKDRAKKPAAGISRSLAPGDRDATLARAQGYIFAAAGLSGLVVLGFPHPPVVDELAAALLGVAAIATGIALYAWAGRVSPALLLAAPALGTLYVSVAVAVSESAISAYTLFYLWIAFYSFYLLSRAQAVVQLVFLALNFAAMLALVGIPATPPENTDVSYIVLATATMASATVLMLYLRARVEGLVGELSGAARTDPLTALPNRRAFREALDGELERAAPARRPVSVLAGDVDRLQALNDKRGHDGADRILIAIGDLLDRSTRRIDTVARIGPGGFGVVLPEVDQEDAYVKAEELVTEVRRRLRTPGETPVTISFGVASYPRRAVDADELLRAADRALFTAKVLGRDRAVVTSPEIDDLLRGSPRRRTGESLTHLKTLLSLAEALDLREGRSAHHAETVGRYAEETARELGLAEPRVARVRLAGILHDIGKVGVPDSILYKEGPLDPEEWEQMKRHPEIGARILGSSELADIREWVLASHEQPDGQGYPRGLAGGEIPLEARIVCVADAYEAMTADRLYRPAIGGAAAREELQLGAGTRYDAEVVEALLAVIDREGARAPRA
jgi:diguanylate cyclase (GGDEF)-like protein/putative nucleotidyltransferase with HDIG domain